MTVVHSCGACIRLEQVGLEVKQITNALQTIGMKFVSV